MESPPLAYIPQKSKKRVFPGSSSSYMDPDVVEISPPINRSSKSKSLKQKEVIRHEIIDVDMYEDCADVILLGGKVDTNNKGKEALVNFSSEPSGKAKLGSTDGVGSLMKSSTLESQNLINLDSFGSDLTYGDEYFDIYGDDFMYDDDYAILQSHFDNIDFPSGVEAPIPWLPGPVQNDSTPASAPAQLRKKSSSSLRAKMDNVIPPHKVDSSSSGFHTESVQSKKNLAGLSSSTYSSTQARRGDVNIPSGSKPFRSSSHSESYHGKSKPVVSGGTSSSHEQLGGMQLHPGSRPISTWSNYSNSRKKQVGRGNSSSHFPAGTINPPLPMPPKWEKFLSLQTQSFPSAPAYFGAVNPFDPGHVFSAGVAHDPWFNDLGKSQKSATTDLGNSTEPPVSPSNFEKYGDEEEIMKKYQLFKKFDTVEDHSDHHYLRNGSSMKQPSKNWAKKIQEEWKILEKDLPDTIFVRVYESRMDLLRAVIVGAEGTPYHDGLFFFDVFFPSSYPNVPPHVYYHSGGLRINPNLYNCGKVCLSLLNTWSGGQKEKWIPGVSTMLQVLVSIQGLILNAKPYFNEPGYAHSSGSPSGEKHSLQYNEDTFIKSLKTMVYTIRRPPKYFEDLVVGHYLTRAHDILVACKAYMDGAQVGCLVRGGVQDVDEGDKSCSQAFKANLSAHMEMVVKAFKQVGAKDCDKFLSLAQTGSG